MPRPWAQKLRSFLSSPDPLWKLTTKEEAMKVRPIKGQTSYTVAEESPTYYILNDPYSTTPCVFVGKKADYEPVQEWVRTYYVDAPLDRVRLKAEGHITIVEVKK